MFRSVLKVTHNGSRLCDVAEKTHLNFKFKTDD